jgi:hypothetical protein
MGQQSFDSTEVTNAAADLDWDHERLADLLDDRGIHARARDRAVKVNNMKSFGPFALPAQGCSDWIIGVDSGLVHVALIEAHAPAGFEVDGGNDKH